jgi:hypothetical protein
MSLAWSRNSVCTAVSGRDNHLDIGWERSHLPWSIFDRLVGLVGGLREYNPG